MINRVLRLVTITACFVFSGQALATLNNSSFEDGLAYWECAAKQIGFWADDAFFAQDGTRYFWVENATQTSLCQQVHGSFAGKWNVSMYVKGGGNFTLALWRFCDGRWQADHADFSATPEWTYVRVMGADRGACSILKFEVYFHSDDLIRIDQTELYPAI